MKDYLIHHPWKIIEQTYNPDHNLISESLFSIGNGRMGQRANFEETFSGETHRGSYLAGIYYPDKTRVGWWKNGYPEYFAKVINSVNWIGIEIKVNGELVDLNTSEIKSFQRELNMQTGILSRSFSIKLQSGILFTATVKRICSLARKELGVIEYTFNVDRNASIEIQSVLDGNVRNLDSNYDEMFWDHTGSGEIDKYVYLKQRTRKTNFNVCAMLGSQLLHYQNEITGSKIINNDNAAIHYQFNAEANKSTTIEKYVALISDFYTEENNFIDFAEKSLQEAMNLGANALFNEHAQRWASKWEECDIVIEGDVEAQQAIRFNIFQLYQTYCGDDPRLNIGPKGFTGEKYGGSTYWDTEAYCLPFYLSTASQEVAKNLLIYRYKHLEKAIENAAKLGFNNGAALYPMVTMNGEECHNEWEITFEEIHRNGAIAYAIYDYINYTGDQSYIAEYGLEVLIGIARFWSQRVNFSKEKNKFVMLGVTGPNEFENNVNNNWYTNKIASWCMQYCAEQIELLAAQNKAEWDRIENKTQFNSSELTNWKNIVANMYYPYDEKLGIYLQQDGFLDKEIIPVSELPASQRPIVEHWSWDRILRSCYIKQADVLQGFYFFEDEFDTETHRKHYDFYEPLTVHESSLSPCIHSILANKLGDEKRAYEFYLRTARLDLNNINNDTKDGCHITSMAGTWLTITKGFAGMRVKNNQLHFDPKIPNHWETLKFNLRFRNNLFNININKSNFYISNVEGNEVEITVWNTQYTLKKDSELTIIKGQLTSN